MAKIDNVLRVGVIGPGGAGRGNTMGFATRPDCEVVAAADVSEGSLQALEKAMQERVEGYTPNSYQQYLGPYEFMQMLEKEDLDIVGIYSPHTLHEMHIRYALRSGAHVHVEKPMATHVGDAIQVANMVKARGLHLVIGYQRHYEPRYVTGRRVIADGLIGDIEKFDVFLAQRWGGGGWRGDPRFSGGGQPNDSGSHLQDIFLWMTGLLPKTAYGTTSFDFELDDGTVVERPIEIDSDTDVEMVSGAKGHIRILGNTRIGFEEWVVLEGTKGTLEFKDGLHFIPKGGKRQEVPQERPEAYPHSKVDQLVGLVKGEYDVNYTSVINGVRTMLLTNAILECGKGPDERNKVDCATLLEEEGYSQAYVEQMIVDGAANNLL